MAAPRRSNASCKTGLAGPSPACRAHAADSLCRQESLAYTRSRGFTMWSTVELREVRDFLTLCGTNSKLTFLCLLRTCVSHMRNTLLVG